MRFYLDEHLSPQIAVIARNRGIDVVSVVELGHRGQSDEKQLLFAGMEGRALVTCNYDDFDRLTHQFFAQGLSHSGVLFIPNSSPTNDYAAIARAIVVYDDDHPGGMPPYMVDYLRRSRL